MLEYFFCLAFFSFSAAAPGGGTLGDLGLISPAPGLAVGGFPWGPAAQSGQFRFILSPLRRGRSARSIGALVGWVSRSLRNLRNAPALRKPFAVLQRRVGAGAFPAIPANDGLRIRGIPPKAAPEVGVALRLQRNLIGFLSTWRVRWPRESAWPCGYSAI